MKRKKYIYTLEQKEQRKIKFDLKQANRSLEQITEDKAKAKIASAKSLANRTPAKIAEHKAKNYIAQVKSLANRSPEKKAEAKAYHKTYNAKWYEENLEKKKAKDARFQEKNPGYRSPCSEPLGYYAVYLIENYNGLGDHYCGQTGNLYNRMKTHKQVGKMNTENHRVLGCFRTREQAMAFEAIQHKSGYHGFYGGL